MTLFNDAINNVIVREIQANQVNNNAYAQAVVTKRPVNLDKARGMTLTGNVEVTDIYYTGFIATFSNDNNGAEFTFKTKLTKSVTDNEVLYLKDSHMNHIVACNVDSEQYLLALVKIAAVKKVEIQNQTQNTAFNMHYGTYNFHDHNKTTDNLFFAVNNLCFNSTTINLREYELAEADSSVKGIVAAVDNIAYLNKVVENMKGVNKLTRVTLSALPGEQVNADMYYYKNGSKHYFNVTPTTGASIPAGTFPFFLSKYQQHLLIC